MSPNRGTLLCRYRYDPLDRLVDCRSSTQARAQRFYLKDRLAIEIEGTVQRSIMQHDNLLLAQRQGQSGALETRLLATDQQRSVLNVLNATRLNCLGYSPYGHRPVENGLLSLLGFNGEQADQATGCYLLGNGYRAFNPVLMRFNSPDSWSPFGEGGLNAYDYCAGDPINRHDPTGHHFVKTLFDFIKNNIQLWKSKNSFELIEVSRPPSKWDKLRRASAPTTETQMKNYYFAGYHGSTDKHHKKLQLRIDTNLGIGKKQLGEGFYATIDSDLAKGYADLAAKNSGGNAKIYGVYVKNYPSMVPERDYSTTIHRGVSGGYTTQTVFRYHVAHMISIRDQSKASSLVRPRSAEAPF